MISPLIFERRFLPFVCVERNSPLHGLLTFSPPSPVPCPLGTPLSIFWSFFPSLWDSNGMWKWLHLDIYIHDPSGLSKSFAGGRKKKEKSEHKQPTTGIPVHIMKPKKRSRTEGGNPAAAPTEKPTADNTLPSNIFGSRTIKTLSNIHSHRKVGYCYGHCYR